MAMRAARGAALAALGLARGFEAAVPRALPRGLATEARRFHRTFLVPFASIPCWPEVDLDRLDGALRLDTFCRCIAAALHLGAKDAPRADSSFLAAFARPSWTSRLGLGLLDSLDGKPPSGARPVGVIEVSGRHLRTTQPSERDLAASLQRTLRGAEEPGWYLSEEESMRKLLLRVLKSRGPSLLMALREDSPVHASEEIARLSDADSADIQHLVIVVGDHIGLRPVASGRLVADFGAKPVTLGPTALLTSQCISILQYLLDTGCASGAPAVRQAS
mmetsp:Transcript_28209/g.63619  ORF Transcript_28209/g.63619 Transcript_28209/m.63619 type:complete len:276 (+) Transcript_28209:28-855(+)